MRVRVRIEWATTTSSTNAFLTGFNSSFRFDVWFLIVARRGTGILTGFLWRFASLEFLRPSFKVFTTGGEVLDGLPEGFADSDGFLSGEAFKVWCCGWHVLVRVADQTGPGDWDEQLPRALVGGGKGKRN